MNKFQLALVVNAFCAGVAIGTIVEYFYLQKQHDDSPAKGEVVHLYDNVIYSATNGTSYVVREIVNATGTNQTITIPADWKISIWK